MVAWWIVVILCVVAFFIGCKVTSIFIVKSFKMQLHDPNSQVRKILDTNLDAMDGKWLEMGAQMAELYQQHNHCLKGCGAEIAKGIRASVLTAKLKQHSGQEV